PQRARAHLRDRGLQPGAGRLARRRARPRGGDPQARPRVRRRRLPGGLPVRRARSSLVSRGRQARRHGMNGMHSPRLTIRELRVRAVEVPMSMPLKTSSGTICAAPFALIDLHTEEGVTGCACLFCYTPLVLGPVAQLVANLAPDIQGDAVSPVDLDRKLQGRFRLLGSKGVAGMALAGIDMAAWDAIAKARGMPLAKALGGELRPIPAYNSCGLGMIGPERAAAEAQRLVAPGFRAIKVRLGYPDLETDVAVVRAVKRAIGAGVELMADYNQSLSVPEALRRVAALDG